MIAPIPPGTDQKRVHSIVESLHARLGEDFDIVVKKAKVEAEIARYSTAQTSGSSCRSSSRAVYGRALRIGSTRRSPIPPDGTQTRTSRATGVRRGDPFGCIHAVEGV